MTPQIEARVAKILSETHLILNRGSSAGVKEGMVFVIVAEEEEVIDPETGKSLGRWEIPKGHVRAIHVQENLTTCVAHAVRDRESESTSADPTTRTLSADMIAVSMRRDTESERVKLNVNRADISGMPAVAPIKVGDKARLIETP